MEFSDKTVFVLNHTAYFNTLGDEISFDSGTKTSVIKTSYRKSIWSNAVDAVLQYCRIVFDIFSHEKPISVITFDTEEKIHSIWLDEDQNIEALWSIFTHEGPPTNVDLDLKHCASMPGLEASCNMLQMLTNSQKEQRNGTNAGRVIILSAFMREQISSWIPFVLAALSKPVGSNEYARITASEWLFIDVLSKSEFSSGADDLPLLPQPIELPTTLDHHSTGHRFLYHRLPASSLDLYRGMMRLVESHYNLASTLVQDIPMKEEANASSSSAMYGVELLHRAEAHDLLRRIGVIDQLMIRMETTEGDETTLPPLQRPKSGFSRTLGIKWVTPKSSDSCSNRSLFTAILRYTTAAYRVTLADVGNRASTCLAQFVLGGRSVALAHRLPISPPSVPVDSRATSIPTNEALVLTCHGSVMYLHTLATVYPLVHPPLTPILDCSKSADLRVQSFIDQIVRPSRLAPASAHQHYLVAPRERAQQHLERFTRYWPLLESETFLGVNKMAIPLFEHLPKEFLEPNEIAACKSAVERLISSIRHNVSLTDTRKGALKRAATSLPVAPSVQAEAVALALELDHMLSVYASISNDHKEIEQYWLNLTGLSTIQHEGGITAILSRAENFASLDLPEMITVARFVAWNDSVPANRSPCFPDSLLKTVRGLSLLCQHTSRDKDLAELSNANAGDKLKWDSRPENSFVLEPANIAIFMELLQPAKRSRTGAVKLEFAGVSSADSNGLCQLYRSLREKEKSVT
ncbi:hypothetical protein EG68_04586 [Paragonimus skrjabini miyazakii]|uniref:Protein asunder n=1 Tax=Paragonimus skrjabini miyazakii TaxID=59628 RepID=A0A8S9YT59_9TREM|nr:hypothetical protein EG68_04586 [Paragonimus skrjabini miyazakii]